MRLKKRRESKVVALNLERSATSQNTSSPELQRKLEQRRKRESFASSTKIDGGKHGEDGEEGEEGEEEQEVENE